jgi:hypothetical protein
MCLSRREFIVGGATAFGLLALPSRATSASAPTENTGRYEPRPITRWCDTRNGADGWQPVDSRTIRVPLQRTSADTIAIAATITVVGGPRAGFVTAFPAGTVRPEASLLNFRSGETRANLGLLMVSPGSPPGSSTLAARARRSPGVKLVSSPPRYLATPSQPCAI